LLADADLAHVTLAEGEKPAAAQDLRGERVASGDELLDVEGLARFDPRDQPEVGGGEEADVVGVLAVDALEALGDDEPDARELLGGRALLARTGLAGPPRPRR